MPHLRQTYTFCDYSTKCWTCKPHSGLKATYMMIKCFDLFSWVINSTYSCHMLSHHHDVVEYKLYVIKVVPRQWLEYTPYIEIIFYFSMLLAQLNCLIHSWSQASYLRSLVLYPFKVIVTKLNQNPLHLIKLPMFNGCFLFYIFTFIFHIPYSNQSNGSFIVTSVYVATKSTAVSMLCNYYMITFFLSSYGPFY